MDNKWLGNEEFRVLVAEKWSNTEIEGCASLKIAYKLKELKNAIKLWAKGEKKKEKGKTDSILAEMSDLDHKEECCGLTDEEFTKKNSLKMQLATILKADEISWSQRSREK